MKHIFQQPLHKKQVDIEPTIEDTQNTNIVGLRKSTKERRFAIFSDYIVYLRESDFDVGLDNDPKLFSQTMSRNKSTYWFDNKKNEMECMAKNQVWNLVELLKVLQPLTVNGSIKSKETP